MNKTRQLFLLAGAALLLWLVCLGLYLEITSHDPYAWAFPGQESEVSRDLYHARKFVYVRVGVVSFVIGVGAGAAGIFLRRRKAN